MPSERSNTIRARIRGWIRSHPAFSPGSDPGAGIGRRREKILFVFMATGLVLGAPTLIPVVLYALSEDHWLLLSLDLAAYGVGLYAFFSRRLSYKKRSAVALGLCYAIGVYVIALVGFISGGPAWLFGYAVMCGCLRGLRSVAIALFLNALTLTTLAAAFSQGWIGGPERLPGGFEPLLAAGFNFMLLNTISAVSVAVLVRGLEASTEKERSAVRTLEDERERLLISQKELRREVAERIGTERALRRSERRYRDLVETSPDIIFQFDFSGTLLFASAAFSEILGYPPEGQESSRLSDLVHPEDVGRVVDAVARLREQGAVRNLECRFKTADGSYVWLSTNAAATLGESGTDRVVFGVSKEITERKEAEARLKSAAKELEQRVESRTAALREANESLRRQMEERLKLQNRLIRSERLAATGLLAASVAHEINSPLQGVAALLNVMARDRDIGPDARENLHLIRDAFERIRDTVRNLLDLNRPTNEKKKPLDLNRVVESTVALTRNYMKKNRIEVELALERDLPPVLGSSQQLSQVLINLINNAVEAIGGETDAGRGGVQSPLFGGHIRVGTEASDGRVYLRIADTGPGLSEADLETVFDPFYTRKKPMGMGVGLSICHGVMEDHDGAIRAENGSSGGAVFTLTFPAL